MSTVIISELSPAVLTVETSQLVRPFSRDILHSSHFLTVQASSFFFPLQLPTRSLFSSSLDSTEKVLTEMRLLLSHSFVLLIVCAAASGTEAFAPLRTAHRSPSISQERTLCFLHPSQAQDLEACAYDLMKEALESKAREQAEAKTNHISQDSSKKLSMEEAGGPVSWARRKLWPAKEVEEVTVLKMP
jgi:hypothetical protein